MSVTSSHEQMDDISKAAPIHQRDFTEVEMDYLSQPARGDNGPIQIGEGRRVDASGDSANVTRPLGSICV